MLPDQIKTITQETLKIQAITIDNVDFKERKEVVIDDGDIEMGGVEESPRNTPNGILIIVLCIYMFSFPPIPLINYRIEYPR